MSLIKIKDTISPDLARRARAAGDKAPHLRAMGQAVKALGIQAFSDASKRPQAWAPRKDAKPHSLLQLTTSLRKSIRVISYSSKEVLIGSDKPYAAIHQLGGDDIPARPYLPFYQSGQLTGLGRERVERALRSSLRSRGL